MKHEDWIILRLLMLGFAHNPKICRDVTFVRSVDDLIKRCGKKTVYDAIDQLHMEKAK